MCYHCFPRRRAGNTDAETVQKGLSILASIVDFGLLLTPEVVPWSEYDSRGKLLETYELLQHRACFTQLSPSELQAHCETFGPFAIEFDSPSLRRLGALPVVYLPNDPGQEGYENLGARQMARLVLLHDLVNRLHVYLQQLRLMTDADTLYAVRGRPPNASDEPLDCTVPAAKLLLESLFGDLRLPGEFHDTMIGFLGYCYPVDDPRHPDELRYYRQREWRLSWSRDQVLDGALIQPSAAARERLRTIDEELFSRTLVFRNGRRTFLDDCYLLQSVRGRHVLSFAQRMYCPQEAIEMARALLSPLNPSLDILDLPHHAAATSKCTGPPGSEF